MSRGMELQQPGECRLDNESKSGPIRSILASLGPRTVSVACLSSKACLRTRRVDQFNMCPNKIELHQNQDMRTANRKKGKILPRSSSPVSFSVDKIPSIVEQAFATIAWDSLEDCTTVMSQDSYFLDSQVNQLDGDDQDFSNYSLDLTADSPVTLESSLSPGGLVPFEVCIIPPLTPHQDFSTEDHFNSQSPDAIHRDAYPRPLLAGLAQYQDRTLRDALETNSQLHWTLHRRQEEIDSLKDRNIQLKELSTRANHLASILDQLMTSKDQCLGKNEASSSDVFSSQSPCKRPRLDEQLDVVPCGHVEDILRDISARCNAVLHHSAQRARLNQNTDSISMYGAFSGLHTSVSKGKSTDLDGTEAGEFDSSFRTSIGEDSTIRTQSFPYGHVFTSRTSHGQYKFRWVPKQS